MTDELTSKLIVLHGHRWVNSKVFAIEQSVYSKERALTSHHHIFSPGSCAEAINKVKIKVMERSKDVDSEDAAAQVDSQVCQKGIETDEFGLLWSLTSVRHLFKDHRMWPTFICPKIVDHKVQRINPPVMLWREQASYLENNQPTEAAGSSSGGKRKEAPTDCQVVDVDVSNKKKHIMSSRTSVSEEESTRNLIFEDLHKRNYFVGPADAYGGDYSLYKGGGDPTQTHSIATVRVIEKGHKISARELLAFSRVQNQVAKSAVLAFKRPTEPGREVENNETKVGSDTTKGDEGEGEGEGPEVVQGEGVGYIVINFRNVSDRV